MRAPTSMEKRVAAALAERAGLVPTDGAIARHLGDAKAAIRAMKEPSVEQVVSGLAAMNFTPVQIKCSDIAKAYIGMMDHASPPDADV